MLFPPPSSLPKRKAAQRRSDIPAEILQQLNFGTLETGSLVEWLSVDLPTLLSVVLPKAGCAKGVIRKIITTTEGQRELGVIQRFRGAAEAIAREVEPALLTESSIWRELAQHRSDVIRSLAAMSLHHASSLNLPSRLEALEVFAVDPNFGTRECAWMAMRPWLMEADWTEVVKQLHPWVKSTHEGLRRAAIESTRPRGVWCSHWDLLKRHPELGLPLLECCREDPSRYVGTSVANWLNDAGKTRPDWLRDVAQKWSDANPGKAGQWIIRHATRSLRKTKSQK